MTIPIDRSDFPLLSAFVRGYLHEDLEDEYGTIDNAVAAYRGAATPAEWAALRAEWRRFADITGAMAFEEISWLLSEELGSRWLPGTPEDLAVLGHALS